MKPTRARWLWVIAAVLLTNCSRSLITPAEGSATMPDPGGCYVLVYDRPQFMGAHEFINGPRKYADMSDLPFRANWRRRIRSVEIGPRASVTMWTDAAFAGISQTFGPGTKHPALTDALSGQVGSIEVGCAEPRTNLTP